MHGKTKVITLDALKGHEPMKELMVKILLILEEIYIFVDLEFDAITSLLETHWQHDETSMWDLQNKAYDMNLIRNSIMVW